MRKKLLAVLLLIGVSGVSQISYGQQRITYTQYMFNGLVLNPAYAGTDKYTNITVQGRQQWMGVKGAPNSQVASANGRSKNGRIGMGMLIEQERIGVTTMTNVYAMYAYKIKVNKVNRLSMGIQAGATTYRERLTDLTLPQGTNDPNFGRDVTYTLPNFGAGLYYYRYTTFYLSFSVPSIAQNTINRNNPLVMTEARQYLFAGGYVFRLNQQLKFKPNFLVKIVKGAPINLDVNMNLLLNEVLWVGFSYQYKNSVNPIIEFQATRELRIGFSYGIPTSQLAESNFRTGSPELMLNYRFAKLMKNKLISPRYF